MQGWLKLSIQKNLTLVRFVQNNSIRFILPVFHFILCSKATSPPHSLLIGMDASVRRTGVPFYSRNLVLSRPRWRDLRQRRTSPPRQRRTSPLRSDPSSAVACPPSAVACYGGRATEDGQAHGESSKCREPALNCNSLTVPLFHLPTV